MAQASKKTGVTEQTYYRWRKEYGGLRLDQAEHLRELEKENARLKRLLADMTLRNAIPKEAASGPAKRTKAVVYQRRQLGEQIVSERRACRKLSQNRSTQRRSPKVAGDNPRLVGQMVELATEYGRNGYRRGDCHAAARRMVGQPQARRTAVAPGGPQSAV